VNTLQNWDTNLDKKIIKIIERDERAYFYRLWKELKVSRNKLNRHLTTMQKQGIIEKDPIKRNGKKRYIVLTKATIGARRLGVFRGIVRELTNRNKCDAENDDQIQKDMRLLVLLLLRAATGITNLKPVKTAEIEKEYFMIEDLKGISVEDIVRFQDNIDLLCNNKIFAYLKFSKQGIKSMMGKLKDEINRFPDLEPIFDLAPYIAYGNAKSKLGTTIGASSRSIRFNSRFELAASSGKSHLNELKRFLVYCDTVLMFVIARMEIKWYSGKRPKHKEVEWFENIFGREVSNLFFFKKLRPIRAQLYKGRVCNSKEAEHNRDMWVKHFYIELFGKRQKKFKNIEKRYPMFYKIVTDVVYPKFLRSDIELESLNKRAASESRSIAFRLY